MAYTRLRYHFITGTHRRRPLITRPVEQVLYPALRATARNANGRVLAVGGVADHVHLVAALRPTVSIANFMRVVKTGSSHAVRCRFGHHAFRWQRGYAAFTVMPFNMERLLNYVARQKDHHASGETWPAYEHCAEDE